MAPKQSNQSRGILFNCVFKSVILLSFLTKGNLSVSGTIGHIESEPYRLDVELTGFPDSTSFVLTDFKSLSDTVMLVEGRASFEIDIPDTLGEGPGDFVLAGPVPFTPVNYCSMIVLGQNGCHERISGDKSQFASNGLNMDCAPWSKELMAWNKQTGCIDAEIKMLTDSVRNSSGKERKRLMDKRRKSYEKLDSLKISMIESNPNSYVSLMYFDSYKSSLPYERVVALYNRLEPKYKESRYGKILAKIVAKKRIEVGDKLADYDIVGETSDGQPFKLSDIKNDYIALIFTSGGCGPCMLMKKELDSLEYSDMIAIVGYVIDDDPVLYRVAVDQSEGKFPLIKTDGEHWNSDAELKYGVYAIPYIFIFGPDRTLVEKTFGYSDGKMKHILDKYVGKGLETLK